MNVEKTLANLRTYQDAIDAIKSEEEDNGVEQRERKDNIRWEQLWLIEDYLKTTDLDWNSSRGSESIYLTEVVTDEKGIHHLKKLRYSMHSNGTTYWRNFIKEDMVQVFKMILNTINNPGCRLLKVGEEIV